ncbi:hypothetical protein Tco_0211067 [Tanacetum coccineum]
MSAVDVAAMCVSGTQSTAVGLPRRLTWDPHADVAANMADDIAFRYEVWKADRGNHWLYEIGIPSQSLARVKRVLEADVAQADWWIWNVTVYHYSVLGMEIRANDWRNH